MKTKFEALLLWLGFSEDQIDYVVKTFSDDFLTEIANLYNIKIS